MLDVIILPIINASCELLAMYIAQLLMEGFYLEHSHLHPLSTYISEEEITLDRYEEGLRDLLLDRMCTKCTIRVYENERQSAEVSLTSENGFILEM